MLAQRKRIAIATGVVAWLNDVLALPRIVLLPLTPEVAATAVALPHPIRDPADQLIVATALHQGVPLVTKDSLIREANVVKTIW